MPAALKASSRSRSMPPPHHPFRSGCTPAHDTPRPRLSSPSRSSAASAHSRPYRRAPLSPEAPIWAPARYGLHDGRSGTVGRQVRSLRPHARAPCSSSSPGSPGPAGLPLPHRSLGGRWATHPITTPASPERLMAGVARTGAPGRRGPRWIRHAGGPAAAGWPGG